VLADSVLGEGSLLGLHMAVFLYSDGERRKFSQISSYEGTIPL